MQTSKGFINILAILIIVVLTGVMGYFTLHQKINPSNSNSNSIACTEEAKLCPDGSYVARTGPSCEFAQCPIINPAPDICEYAAPPKNCTYIKGPNYNSKTMCGMVLKCQDANQVSLHEGEREGPLLVEKIYANYITGLSFREYPVAMDKGQPITLYIGESVSNGCTITLTLIGINNKTAIFTETTDFNRPCPICLAEGSLIDTPSGAVAVQQLKTGMPVWTVDLDGKRVQAVIIKTSKTPVPKTHQMVHIILADGRQLSVSPGHPVGDGRVFENLLVGDFLDGSQIMSTQKITYDKSYTYDILPSGDTGFYFANKILIDSTLH